MGRIKTILVKRAANELVKGKNNKFKKSFDENKKIVDKLTIIRSKKLRNIITGQVTRLVKKEN